MGHSLALSPLQFRRMAAFGLPAQHHARERGGGVQGEPGQSAKTPRFMGGPRVAMVRLCQLAERLAAAALPTSEEGFGGRIATV